MNEKIKELMNQTGVPVSMPFDKWCEKFAELIVQECIDIVDQYGKANMESDAWAEMLTKMQADIKQHFGVEP